MKIDKTLIEDADSRSLLEEYISVEDGVHVGRSSSRNPFIVVKLIPGLFSITRIVNTVAGPKSLLGFAVLSPGRSLEYFIDYPNSILVGNHTEDTLMGRATPDSSNLKEFYWNNPGYPLKDVVLTSVFGLAIVLRQILVLVEEGNEEGAEMDPRLIEKLHEECDEASDEDK